MTSKNAARLMKNTDIRRAVNALDGLPEGGWGQTAQAVRRISDELPRGVAVWPFIKAVSVVDLNDRYKVTF